MIKTTLLFLLFMAAAIADSYNFTELRYSDATGRYSQLDGQISFGENALNIKYPKAQRELDYKDDVLVYHEDAKEVDLDESQAERIMRYFDVLKLLHGGDESELKETFEIDDSSDKTLLTPLGSMKYYIERIELTKEESKLKSVKLFLKNSDNISVNIDDEIR
jgi:hypothetical protein